MSKRTLRVIAIGAVALTLFACEHDRGRRGQEPVVNVNPNRHENIAAAQELVRKAYDRLTVAQQANEFDLAGHAARAKDLLREANDEMKLAAVAANRH